MDVWEPFVVSEKRTQLWETPSPTTLARSGCSFWKAPPCQGHQCYCFFPISCCHLIRIEPVLPTIGIPLGPRPFHSSDASSSLHLYFLSCKKQSKGDLQLDACSRPGGCVLQC